MSLVVTGVLLWVSSGASAAVLEVGGGKPYATIQAAVNAAGNDDEIIVYAGTYGGFTINGKDQLTVRAYKDPALCATVNERVTVDMAIYCRSGADNNLIRGFYVANYTTNATCGSYDSTSGNTWRNLVIYGGISCGMYGSNMTGADLFDHCTIYDKGYVVSYSTGPIYINATNTIAAFNSHRGYPNGTVTYSDFFDNPNPASGYTGWTVGAGCISADPQFVSTVPSHQYFLHLLAGSACIGTAGDGGNMGALPTYDPDAVMLVSSEPGYRGVLPRAANNTFKLVFSTGINPGELPSVPLTIIESGTPTDLGNSFSYLLATTNETNDTLIATESGSVLADKTWYDIEPAGSWCTSFTVDMVVLHGDIDGDGDVFAPDYCLLADAWGNSGPDLGRVDLNKDNNIDIDDLSVLLGNWSERGFTNQNLITSRNLEAPFPYVHEGTRCWPITTGYIPSGTVITLKARDGATVLDEGTSLSFSGFTVSLGLNGKLQIVSAPGSSDISFELDVLLDLPDGSSESQNGLEVRPAPPDRPISYVADTSDDFYYIFPNTWEDSNWKIDKAGFDQYFRRLQAQGVTRLVAWLMTFPYVVDPDNYSQEDWDRHEKQSRAIIESSVAQAGTWSWGRRMLSPRLQQDFGEKLSKSAMEHGIPMAISYRPFEPALTKYYEIPTFASDGSYLWGFLPFASPALNYHPEDICYSHYRTMLADMGHPEMGRLGTIEIENVQNPTAFLNRWTSSGDNLKIEAANFAPIQDDSYVLQRQTDGSFDLVEYSTIKAAAQSQMYEVTGFDVELDGSSILITNLSIPDQYRYIMLSNPAEASESLNFNKNLPVKLWSQAGYPIGRENVYWALNSTIDPSQSTYIAGITPGGGFNMEFQATESSISLLRYEPTRRDLVDETLVIDHGRQWSVELIDFNQQAARDFVVAELETILAYPAFDEIFINTRTHTDSAGYMADTLGLVGSPDIGVAPIADYIAYGYSYTRLGVHLSYTPQSSASNSRMLTCVADPGNLLEKITQFQDGEFSYSNNPCQLPTTNYDWRYVRNQESANGIRELMIDLEDAFPGRRVRIVLPERQAATEAVMAGLDLLGYGSNYMTNIWSTNNYTYMTCEGMAMVDLTALATEPVFSGIRYGPSQDTLELYVDECIIDMADNHGSSFSGARSFFYEAGETVGVADARREEIICYLLSESADINEVILYEAATWMYSLDINDWYLYGHYFLDSCP